jgi:hypothetical protein
MSSEIISILYANYPDPFEIFNHPFIIYNHFSYPNLSRTVNPWLFLLLILE